MAMQVEDTQISGLACEKLKIMPARSIASVEEAFHASRLHQLGYTPYI